MRASLQSGTTRLTCKVADPERGACDFPAAPTLESKLAGKPEVVDLSAVAWTDGDIAWFLDRRARLLRWGWPESDAEKLAERLVKRDREADPRVSCTDCRHYRPGRCDNHRRAGLNVAEMGRDLAAMLQRCAGFDVRTTTWRPNSRAPNGAALHQAPAVFSDFAANTGDSNTCRAPARWT